MNLKIVTIAGLLAISAMATCQTESELNKTDQLGRKQGHWIKKYPDENVLYDGSFKDDHPVGEFKRYYENKKLMSSLVYNDAGTEAIATFYHPNGFISSKGKYINRLKEGTWQFYSVSTEGYLLSEDHYSKNLRNGLSTKFFPDSTIAERVTYINNLRQGQCVQYYPNAAVCLKSNYLNGKVNGKFEVWFENGHIEFSGQYKNDERDGQWLIYNREGTVKYKMEYIDGVTHDNQMDIDESDFLDSLEKNTGNIADPEKTGKMW